MHDCSDCNHCPHYFELLHIVEDMKKRLQYYENPNSPPSSNSLLWRKQKKERRERVRNGNGETKKPGRRKGHEGVSHSFKPTETIEHKMKRCGVCGSPKISFSSRMQGNC